MDQIVSSIVQLLVSRSGYRHGRVPLRVAEIDFRFDAVLVGPRQGDGLVVIVDLHANTSITTARRIRGLITVLDRLQSRRTVSVVLVVRADVKFALEELEQCCHIVLVRPGALLENSLRSLLPLVLPTPEASTSSAEEALRRELDSAADEPFIMQLIQASHTSQSEIDNVLRHAIDDAVALIEEHTVD